MTEFTQWCTTSNYLMDASETGWTFRLMHAGETGVFIRACEYRGKAPESTFEEIEDESLKERYLRRKEWEAVRKVFAEPAAVQDIELSRGVPLSIPQSQVVLMHIDHKLSDGMCRPNAALIKVAY